MKSKLLMLILLLAATIGTYAESVNLRMSEGDNLEDALNALNMDLESITSLTISGPLDLEEGGFGELTNLETLDLRNARFDTFNGCEGLDQLKTLYLPACLKEGNYSALYGCSSLKDVYCYSVLPYAQNLFNGVYEPCTLHVPAVALEAYRQKIADDEWKEETIKVIALDEPLSDACIFRYFTLENLEGWQNTNVEMSYLQSWGDYMTAGALTVNAPNETWHIGTFSFPINFWEYYEQYDDDWNPVGSFYNRTGTLLCQSPVEAQEVVADLVDDPYYGEWTFFSLPFDVKMSDITSNVDTRYVIRRYSGENRATLKGSTWVNVGKDETLNAYEGYILKRDRSQIPSAWTSDDIYYFRLPAADNENKQNMFRTGDVTIPVKPYPAAMTHNSGWNLLGNPYPCFFSINKIAEQVVIMMYDEDNLTYLPYSTRDDKFMLRPYDAFFIQYSEDVPQLTFKAEGRIAQMKYGKPFYGKDEEEDYNDDDDDDWDDDDWDDDDWDDDDWDDDDWDDDDWDDDDWNSDYGDDNDDYDNHDDENGEWAFGDDEDSEWSSEMVIRFLPKSPRTLYNIFLSDGEHQDRVRLVINPEASLEYELQRDAMKMVPSEVKTSQIYLSENGLRCAIDERPVGEGVFPLGMIVGKEGTHTLHLQAGKKCRPLYLTDRTTGISVDLSKEDYTFHAEAGTTEGRLYLSLGAQADGIKSVNTNVNTPQSGKAYDLSGRPVQKGKEKGIIVSKESKTLYKNK